MRNVRIVCLILAIMPISFLSSCDKLPAAKFVPRVKSVSLLPGECLMDNELTCIYCNQSNKGKTYLFRFLIDMDIEREQMGFSRKDVDIERYRPTDDVFQQFGVNSEALKDAYNSVWNTVYDTQSTFFYDDIVLTADRDFAGISKGDNIAPLFIPNSTIEYVAPFGIQDGNMLSIWTMIIWATYGPENNMDDYMNDDVVYHQLEKQAVLGFGIDVTDKYKFVKQSVNFTLTIPVRSAQYLTWLNDKLSDENAQMTWKDEVLTCTFHSNTGLQVISE